MLLSVGNVPSYTTPNKWSFSMCRGRKLMRLFARRVVSSRDSEIYRSATASFFRLLKRRCDRIFPRTASVVDSIIWDVEWIWSNGSRRWWMSSSHEICIGSRLNEKIRNIDRFSPPRNENAVDGLMIVHGSIGYCGRIHVLPRIGCVNLRVTISCHIL